MNIEAIFEAEAVSISNLFSTDGGNVGFRIPIYQRPYDWTTANIQRLFEDMLSGIEWRSTNPDSLSFIGTIITLSGEKKEVSFDGQSLSIIDGQQRLTTISLLSCILHDQIRAAVVRLSDKPVEGKIIDWLKSESKHTLLKLLNVIRGNLITGGGTGVYPFPRIIREEFDNRASSFAESQYDSTISLVLFKFASEYLGLGDNHLQTFPEWMEFNTSEESVSVKRNLLLMQQFTQGVRDSDESQFPSDFASDFIPISKLARKGFKNLMQKLPLDDRVAANILDICSSDLNSREVVRLIAFANYLLEGVVVTLVKVKDEKYGFDIFESLNSTGEPLTAIQTFKPAVIKFEQTGIKYKGSLSEQYFAPVEDYTNSFTKTSVKQRVSKEIVVSFALYITGEKIGGGLDAQRRYLRNNFEQINKGKNVLNFKRDFIKHLSEITAYRKLFWTNHDYESIPNLGRQRQKLLLCLAFLRDSKYSLSIPVLCRYYNESKSSNDPTIFSDAAFALTAFVVLRRSVTGNTANIDSDFRGLMSSGFDTKDESAKKPICIGRDINNPLPSIEDFQKMLRQRLAKKQINIVDKNDWIERSSSTELYGKSTPLCKFLILAASHNARSTDSGRKYILSKARPSKEVDFLNYATWMEEQVATVEHIAPDQPGENWSSGQYLSIYQLPYLKNTVGNLTLLPGKENASLGNRSWDDKKMLFQAFSASRIEEIEDLIKEAKGKGFNFHKNTQRLLKERAQLPLASAITDVEYWTKDVIQSRSKNIVELVWNEISDWVGL